MKVLARCSLLAICGILLLSCGTASKEITLKSRSERKGVFSESAKGPIPAGMAELRIRASIKAKLERQFLPGPSKGIPASGYPFLLNIDGQAATWRVGGQRERNGKTRPERGEGLRYILERKLTLSAGSHKVFFGLPEEDAFAQFDVTMREGESYVLEFQPLYGECLTGHKSFLHGVSRLDIVLNGDLFLPYQKLNNLLIREPWRMTCLC
jgi:hypothetical protein